MPNDNMTRAIKRGTGELEGVTYEEVSYEGYGPGGVAFMVECITDNKNRTVAEVRHIFTKNNGNLGENGSDAWKFNRTGIILIPAKYNEDELMMTALDAGAEDMKTEGDQFEIYTAPTELDTVKSALEGSFEITEASIHRIPQNTIKVEGKEAEGVLRLFELLEDHDDVQNVSADFDIDADVMEAL